MNNTIIHNTLVIAIKFQTQIAKGAVSSLHEIVTVCSEQGAVVFKLGMQTGYIAAEVSIGHLSHNIITSEKMLTEWNTQVNPSNVSMG